jgi:hypothetical protein
MIKDLIMIDFAMQSIFEDVVRQAFAAVEWAAKKAFSIDQLAFEGTSG